MPTRPPYKVPWPLSTWPGANPQESAGRLINCHSEPLGENAPNQAAWHRAPGMSIFASTSQSGYRGGLIANNLSYEVWSGQAATVDTNGNVSLLGSFPGTKKISIARDQAKPNPDVVAVDLDNGAYVLSGGGAPSAYNGGGNLPQPNSVTFQDGYFFYGIGDCRVFASPLNSVGTINALTFITLQAKSSVTGQRVIAYSGVLFCFTTGSCEVWQDAAAAAPNFPYSRMVVLEYGLLDPRAVAGFEDFFSVLHWVAQDFGVYQLIPGSLTPLKVSPPDLDRLIEAQASAGNELAASCYVFAGKKFWVLSSPAWTWEFNVGTGKWNERQSATSTGQGAWRGVGGHPAFGKWLLGDSQSGTLAYIDDAKVNELGGPLLFRMESGPVDDFPNRMRVARADFDFVVGAAASSRALQANITGAAADAIGQIKLTVVTSDGMVTGDIANVASVGGTTEANGTWSITVNDTTHVTLQQSVFVHAYTSGGTITDVTPPQNFLSPSVAISWSDDGGMNWGNPLVRSLGLSQRGKRTRISVKNTGTSGPMGRRWRIDLSDRTYTSFLGSTQDSDPREK